MEPFEKSRQITFDIGENKTVTVNIAVRVEKNGQVYIFTKLGDEPTVQRVTSIYNSKIVKEHK